MRALRPLLAVVLVASFATPARADGFFDRVRETLSRLFGSPPSPTAATPRAEEYYAEVSDKVVLGARPSEPAVGYGTLERLGVTAILDMRAEAEDDRAWIRERGVVYKRIPVVDYTAPTPEQLREAVRFIQLQTRAGRKVYVHCKGGIGRSATVVAAWLVAEKGWSADRAWEFLLEKRPIVKQTPEQRAALEAFAKEARPVRVLDREVLERRRAEAERSSSRGLTHILERRIESERDRDKDRDRPR